MNVGDVVSYHTASGHKPARIVGFADKRGAKIVYVDIRHPSGHICTVPRTSLTVQGDLFGDPEIAEVAVAA